MPLYEYLCDSCSQRTEALQRLDEPPLTVCPNCGGALRKLLSAPAFQFKGSGWYVTDYAGKGRGESKGTSSAKSDAATSSASAPEKSSEGSATKETPAPGGKAAPTSGSGSGGD